MDFFSVMPRGKIVPCRFCGGFDGVGHLFCECTHLSLVQTIAPGQDVFSGMVGCLPSMELVRILVGLLVQVRSLRICERRVWGPKLFVFWMSGFLLIVILLLMLLGGPCLFSLMSGQMGGLCGMMSPVLWRCGVYARVSGSAGFRKAWWHLDLLPPDLDLGSERCLLYCSAPRPLQSVQRAELCGMHVVG